MLQLIIGALLIAFAVGVVLWMGFTDMRLPGLANLLTPVQGILAAVGILLILSHFGSL